MTIPFPLPASPTPTPVIPEPPVASPRSREAGSGLSSRDFADALAGQRKPAPKPQKTAERDVSIDDRRLDGTRKRGSAAESTSAPEAKPETETTPRPAPETKRNEDHAEPASSPVDPQQSTAPTAQPDAPSAQVLPQPLVETSTAPVHTEADASSETRPAADTAASRAIPLPTITVGNDVPASTDTTDITTPETPAPRHDAGTGAALTPDAAIPASTGSEEHRPVDATPTPFVASEDAGVTPIHPPPTDTTQTGGAKSATASTEHVERPIDTLPEAARRATPDTPSTPRTDTSTPVLRDRPETTSSRPATSTPPALRSDTSTATPRVDDTTPNVSRNVTPPPTPTTSIDVEVSATNAADRNATSGAHAAARATQVQNGVHLENLTGQDGVDAARLGSTTIGSNATAGGSATLATMLGSVGSSGALGRDVATDIAGARVEIEPAPGTSDRIVRSLSTMVNQRGGVMNMRLSPPELGALRVQMTIHQGVVTADFTATSQQTQSLLQQNLASLRSALEGHGLQVERLGVHVSTPEGSNLSRHDGGQDTQSDHRDGRQDAAGRESRGRQDEQPRDGERTPRPAASFADDLAPFFAKAAAEATPDETGRTARGHAA